MAKKTEPKHPSIREKFKSLRIRPYVPGCDSISSLSKEMIQFAHHPDSRTIPQFLALKEISLNTIKYWMRAEPRLKNNFDTMMSILWCKWFDWGMESKNLPAHQAKMLEKYLNLYDEHLFEAMTAKQKEMVAAQVEASRAYSAENYKTVQLTDQYSKIYEANDGKRTDPSESGEPERDVSAESVSAEGISEADIEGP